MTRHRDFPERALFTAGATALLALSLTLAGCKHGYSAQDDPASGPTSELLAPSPAGAGTDFARARSLYPLAIGNHWDYRVRTRTQLTTDAGPQPPETQESTITVDITGTTTLDDRSYFVQREVDPRWGIISEQQYLVRGSRFGLFEALLVRTQPDATVGESPADAERAALTAYVERTITDPAQRAAFQRAAADVAAKLAAARPVLGGVRPRQGAAPGETMLLSYPLYAGARWLVLEEPRFGRVVVGLDRIRVPLGTFAAWKLRGTSESFGPNDRLHLWYSNLGLLRIRYHFEVDAVDNTGTVIGRAALDSDQSLTGIHLVRGAALAAGGE